MGFGFTADLAALTNASRQAQRLTDTLREHTQHAFADDETTFGHADLEQAVREFQACWRDGLTGFTTEGDCVAQRLATSMVAYQDVDRAGADTFTRLGGRVG